MSPTKFTSSENCGCALKTSVNRGRNGDKKKTVFKRGRLLFRALVRFRKWNRRKRRVKISVDNDTSVSADKFERVENSHFLCSQMIQNVHSKSLEQINKSVEGISVGFRLKTRIAQLMRRRRVKNVTSKSILLSASIAAQSRRSVVVERRKISPINVILKPFGTLRRKTAQSESGRLVLTSNHQSGRQVIDHPISSQKLQRSKKPKLRIRRRRKWVKGLVLPEEKCANWLNHRSPLRVVLDGSCILREKDIVHKNRNRLKLKFIQIFKRFKKAGVDGASLAGNMSSGDNGVVELIDLMEHLSLDNSTQVLENISELTSTEMSTSSESLSTSEFTLPKPKLRPFFQQESLHFVFDQDENKYWDPNTDSKSRMLLSHYHW